MQITTGRLAAKLGARIAGCAESIITGVSGIESATMQQITFATEEKSRPLLYKSEAAAVIVNQFVEDLHIPQIIVPNVHKSLICTLKLFTPPISPKKGYIDPSAKMGNNVSLGRNITLEAYVVIEENCKIGDNTIIAAGSKIGRNTIIGANCRIDTNVSIYHDCHIGNQVILQAGVVIGSCGFGYYYYDDSHNLIPHIGTVVIEDFVEIGANTCVDRAKFDATRIGAGTKIDNLVQIGHNSIIGRCCLIAAMTGISGSCKIGDGVVMGGQVGVSDHVTIGNKSMIAAQSGIMKDIPPGKKFLGTPAKEIRKAFKSISLIDHLPELYDRLRQVEVEIQKSKQETAFHY